MAALSPMPNADPRNASEKEVAIAFAALNAADYARLARIAQLRARGLPELDWRDLLHDATTRALEGARRWPADVPFMAFVAQTLRSVASEAWRRRVRDGTRTAALGEPEGQVASGMADV